MQNEFYRSQTEVLPTFSLVLAVSLVGLNSTTPIAVNPVNGATGIVRPPTSGYALAYYGHPEQLGDQAHQVETLRHFAEALLKDTQDSPQAVVDMVNRHFWDLV